MTKTLFISDLDGTLLSSGGRLSATTVSLLNHAISRGALFSVATARTPATVSVLLKDVDVRIPLVVMTGGALWDMRTGRYSEVQYFDPAQIDGIVDAYVQAGGGAFLYTLPRAAEGDRDIFEIYHIGEMTPVESEFMRERIDSPFKVFHVDAGGNSLLPETIDDAVLFFGMQPAAVGADIYRSLKVIPRINPMIYHDWHGPEVAEIEAFPATTTKAQGIKRLARLVGADRVVVYGDNVNDLSMMAVADWAVAVGNAVPEVKEAADEVIGTNDADAVARHILESL